MKNKTQKLHYILVLATYQDLTLFRKHQQKVKELYPYPVMFTWPNITDKLTEKESQVETLMPYIDRCLLIQDPSLYHFDHQIEQAEIRNEIKCAKMNGKYVDTLFLEDLINKNYNIFSDTTEKEMERKITSLKIKQKKIRF